MLRKVITIIDIIIIFFMLVAGGYKLYEASREPDPFADMKTRPMPFHNSKATTPALYLSRIFPDITSGRA